MRSHIIQGDAIRVQLVLEELEAAAHVALPAVRVAGKEEVEAVRSEVLDHSGHRGRAPDSATAVGDLVQEPAVDEAVAPFVELHDRQSTVQLATLTGHRQRRAASRDRR